MTPARAPNRHLRQPTALRFGALRECAEQAALLTHSSSLCEAYAKAHRRRGGEGGSAGARPHVSPTGVIAAMPFGARFFGKVPKRGQRGRGRPFFGKAPKRSRADPARLRQLNLAVLDN